MSTTEDPPFEDGFEPPLASTPKTPKAPLRVVTADERSSDKRPEVQLLPDSHLVTAGMIAALEKDPWIFQRAGKLVHLIRETKTVQPDPALGIKVGTVKGTPKIREAPVSLLVDRVSEHARCMRFDSRHERWKHVTPPKASVQAVAERGQWKHVRPITGIVESPSMRPDGTVIQKPGYDVATGYLYAPNAFFSPVAESPTHSHAVSAYTDLLEPFRQFPYVNDSHQAATVAALLTLIARPAIWGSIPCWLFDASSPRSGKSLQVDVITTIATGRQASRTTYPDTDDELEKILAGYALDGAAIVNFDNVARKFGGAALDKMITATDTVDVRVLGRTGQVNVEWRGVIFASGNNVGCRGDMLARVLSPRLETTLDNPEQRSDFDKPDLRAWVRQHRTRLHHAALTLLRAFVVAGRPGASDVRWGGFEGWSALIPAALRWVGAVDPMGARRGLDGDDDPERQIARAVVEGWELLHAAGSGFSSLTVKQAIGVLYPPRSRHDDEPPDTRHDALKEAIETATSAKPGFPPATKALGDLLHRIKAKPIGGKKLVRDTTAGHGGVAKWRVVPVR